MALSKKLTKMYFDGKFRKGRSQQAIREVQRAFKHLPENDDRVRDFFKKEQDWQALQPFAEKPEEPADLVKLCEQLVKTLVSVDADALSAGERKILTRTRAVLNEVLAS